MKKAKSLRNNFARLATIYLPFALFTVMVRVTVERDNDNSWVVKTSNLKKLRQAVGEDVFDYFCCCFLHADRITSLINFLKLSQEPTRINTAAAKRDRWTIFYLLIGEMKEFELDLGRLRGELSKKNIWDKITWDRNLKKLEIWAQKPEIAQIRNHSSFHIIKTRINNGLNSIHSKKVTIYKGENQFNINSICELAQDALIRGLQIETSNDIKGIIPAQVLEDVFNDATLIEASLSIQSEFLRVLKRVGVTPIPITISKAKVKK